MSTATSPIDFRTTANNKEGGDYELPPCGTHPAVLVALIDLGTHKSTYPGKPDGERHKIMLCWELTAETDSKGENFIVGQDYTWSLGKKAHLRDVVQGFRGKDLADGEEFDLGTMLGQPCIINLTEGVSGGGKKFREIAAVNPPMRGLAVPPASRPVFAFLLSLINSTLDAIDVPEWVPRNYGRLVIDDIKASKEYLALPNF